MNTVLIFPVMSESDVSHQLWGYLGTPKDMGPPYGKRDPYHSHIFRDSYGSGMGIVREAYHKGVPL